MRQSMADFEVPLLLWQGGRGGDKQVELLNRSSVQVGVASRALGGGPESGDAYLTRALAEGVLLAAIDGIGHGPEAALSAKEAIGVLEADPEKPLQDLVIHCHRRLQALRGAVMTLVRLKDDGQVSCLGVGNVKAAIFRTRRARSVIVEDFVPRGGIIGRRLPSLHVVTSRVQDGDLLILATDGVRPEFASMVRGDDCPQQVAQQILDEYCTGRDDALVLAIRYRQRGL